MEMLTAQQARNLTDTANGGELIEKIEDILTEVRRKAMKGYDYINIDFYKNRDLANQVIPRLNKLGYETKEIEQYDPADKEWIEYTINW